MKNVLPLLYSCSGCSSAAQTANAVASRLDREGTAEMTCIAGVGADLPAFVKEAKSGRAIIALDGCPLACVKHSLARHGVEADHYYEFSKYGVRRKKHKNYSESDADQITDEINAELSEKYSSGRGPERTIGGDGK